MKNPGVAGVIFVPDDIREVALLTEDDHFGRESGDHESIQPKSGRRVHWPLVAGPCLAVD